MIRTFKSLTFESTSFNKLSQNKKTKKMILFYFICQNCVYDLSMVDVKIRCITFGISFVSRQTNACPTGRLLINLFFLFRKSEINLIEIKKNKEIFFTFQLDLELFQ